MCGAQLISGCYLEYFQSMLLMHLFAVFKTCQLLMIQSVLLKIWPNANDAHRIAPHRDFHPNPIISTAELLSSKTLLTLT